MTTTSHHYIQHIVIGILAEEATVWVMHQPGSLLTIPNVTVYSSGSVYHCDIVLYVARLVTS